MHVSEKLPCVVIRAAIAKERTVIQINLLFIHLNIHLHRYLLEVFRVILPQVLDVVVAGNKVYFPVQPVQYVYPFGRTAQTEIAQVEHDILRTDHAVPVGNNRFIHVRHILEGSVAEPNDIGVVEVGIRCKEHPASVKFIIHNFSFMRITARLITHYNSTRGRN